MARFEGFFHAMQTYDIAPLLSAPHIVSYIRRVYLNSERLTQERVQRASSACGALFRWYGSVSSRLEAALELLEVDVQLEDLQSQLVPNGTSWMCKADHGWVYFPPDINAQINAADGTSQPVTFELDGTTYEVAMGSRCQRNVIWGTVRPIRPGGDQINMQALQGCWQASWGSEIQVQGTTVIVNGTPAISNLEDRCSEGIR